MSPLSDYKKGLILARTQLYNVTLASLLSYYRGLVDTINANKSLTKRAKINNLNAINRAKIRAIYLLRVKYNADIMQINRIRTVPIVPIVPIVRTVPTKTAVLVGINYIGTPNQLNGCINDTIVVSSMLKTNYGYKTENMSFMTDRTSIKPTGMNIRNAFTDLLQNAISGDSLFLFYSGHGTQKANNNNLNPSDKIDECIYPLDGDIITDVTFKKIINANMKTGVNLVAVFDSCFSGTVMNLKYNYLSSDYNNTLFVDSYESVTAGEVVCISGCKDNQTSEDAYINGVYGGALTWAMSSTISSNASLSWAELVDGMRAILSTNTFTQLPQLSSSNQMDMSEIVVF